MSGVGYERAKQKSRFAIQDAPGDGMCPVGPLRSAAEPNITDERVSFVVLCACDAKGSRIFQEEDVGWLNQCALWGPMIERLY
jgi:hypothetical protein